MFPTPQTFILTKTLHDTHTPQEDRRGSRVNPTCEGGSGKTLSSLGGGATGGVAVAVAVAVVVTGVGVGVGFSTVTHSLARC